MGNNRQQVRTSSNRPRGTVGVLRTFSNTLARAWALMSEAQRQFLAEMHSHFLGEFTRVRKDDPVSVAASVHAVIDDEVARQAVEDAANFARVQCREGCAHCCKQNVTITRPEARLALEYAREQGVTVDWDRVKRQASHAGAAAWTRQPVADMACAFLGPDDRCRIYKHRPAACRKLYAVSDPADCDIVANPGTQVLFWAPPTVEVVASAAYTVFESASMPVMLTRVRKEHS